MLNVTTQHVVLLKISLEQLSRYSFLAEPLLYTLLELRGTRLRHLRNSESKFCERSDKFSAGAIERSKLFRLGGWFCLLVRRILQIVFLFVLCFMSTHSLSAYAVVDERRHRQPYQRFDGSFLKERGLQCFYRPVRHNLARWLCAP